VRRLAPSSLSEDRGDVETYLGVALQFEPQRAAQQRGVEKMPGPQGPGILPTETAAAGFAYSTAHWLEVSPHLM
jgi:hypothetical protein